MKLSQIDFASLSNAREAAFLASLRFEREGIFLKDSLQIISEQTRKFSWELSLGSMRRKESLKYLAKELVSPQKLSLKKKERIVFQQALYQFFYMKSVPLRAIVFESVALAKKYCGQAFAKFLNHQLRKLETKEMALPQQKDAFSLSVFHSFPLFFIQKILEQYPSQSEEIFEALNSPVSLQVRSRTENKTVGKPLSKEPVAVFEIDKLTPELSDSENFYIQNITQAHLSSTLCQKMGSSPENILDLCASPGGKSLIAHDFFPKANIFANDLSPKKLDKLKQNFKKYGVKAEIICQRAQDFRTDQPFDLVIADLPCSNSGVLFKRAEARWRVERENLQELEKEQMEILNKALEVVKKGGYLWHMTCSILKCENENLSARLQDRADILWQRCQIPQKGVFEGGYAALLKKK